VRITVPLKSIKDIDSLVKAGANEFYAGLVTREWHSRYGSSVEVNRRGFLGPRANFTSTANLAAAIQRCHELHRPVFITLNHLYYVDEQMDLVASILKTLNDIEADGVILADMGALLCAREVSPNLKILISGTEMTQNSETSQFYHELGAQRIILPRHLVVSEIRQIIANVPELEYEVFIMNGGCKFSEGLCTVTHSTEFGGLCQFLGLFCNYSYQRANYSPVSLSEEKNLRINELYYHKFFWPYYRTTGVSEFADICGLCAVRALMDAGVGALKIVGRNMSPERVRRQVQLLKRAVHHAATSSCTEDYHQRIKDLYPPPDMCDWGYRCYFPEVRHSNHT